MTNEPLDDPQLVAERPVYPAWIRSRRTVIFWLVGSGLVAAGVLISIFWPPALAVVLLATPFLYIAVVLFVHGSASRLPFSTGEFGRVVSCLTFHEVRDAPDKTASLAEALRVLEPGGRFAVVDLFDDKGFYAGRDRALEVIVDAGGEIGSAQTLSEIFEFRFPLNLAKVLKYAVIVTGTKSYAPRRR